MMGYLGLARRAFVAIKPYLGDLKALLGLWSQCLYIRVYKQSVQCFEWATVYLKRLHTKHRIVDYTQLPLGKHFV